MIYTLRRGVHGIGDFFYFFFFQLKLCLPCVRTDKRDSLQCPSTEHGWTEQSWVSRPTSLSQFTRITVIMCCQLLQIDPDILAELFSVCYFFFSLLTSLLFLKYDDAMCSLHNVVFSIYVSKIQL